MNLLKPFDPWKSSLCSCPPKYSLSAYTGCSHGCLYCYASSYIPKFCQPRPKKDFLLKLKKEVGRLPAESTIAIANSSDPYQPLEKIHQLTGQALSILQDFDLKISLVTKSTLFLKDISLLKKIKKITLSVSISSLDENLLKKLEPNCPSPLQRLAAVKKISSFLPVAVRLDPLIYPITTESLEKTIQAIKKSGAKQIITSTYKIKPDSFKRMVDAFPHYSKLWQKIYFEKGSRKNNYTYLQDSLRKDLIEKVKAASLQAGLKFSSCREGLPALNTSPCDGASLFN